MVEYLKAKMLKTTVPRFERPTRKPSKYFEVQVVKSGITMPMDSSAENSHKPDPFNHITVKQRAKLTMVCTKSRFIGSMSPNQAYIFLLIKLTARPARPYITLKNIIVKAENYSSCLTAYFSSFFTSLASEFYSFCTVYFLLGILKFLFAIINICIR